MLRTPRGRHHDHQVWTSATPSTRSFGGRPRRADHGGCCPDFVVRVGDRRRRSRADRDGIRGIGAHGHPAVRSLEVRRAGAFAGVSRPSSAATTDAARRGTAGGRCAGRRDISYQSVPVHRPSSPPSTCGYDLFRGACSPGCSWSLRSSLDRSLDLSLEPSSLNSRCFAAIKLDRCRLGGCRGFGLGLTAGHPSMGRAPLRWGRSDRAGRRRGRRPSGADGGRGRRGRTGWCGGPRRTRSGRDLRPSGTVDGGAYGSCRRTAPHGDLVHGPRRSVRTRAPAEDDLVQVGEDSVQPVTDHIGAPRRSRATGSRHIRGLTCVFNPLRILFNRGRLGRCELFGAERGFQFEARICNPLVSALVGGRGPHAHAEAQLHHPRRPAPAGNGRFTPSPYPCPPHPRSGSTGRARTVRPGGGRRQTSRGVDPARSRVSGLQ